MLEFPPLDEREILNLLDVGTYEFYTFKAEDTTSKKSGRPMIKLILKVIDKNGEERTVTDYLIDTMLYKVKHYCDSVGLEEEYKSGNLNAALCEGRSGKVKIIIDEPEEDSAFNPKNAVKDYVKHLKPIEKPADPTGEFLNDAIPF